MAAHNLLGDGSGLSPRRALATVGWFFTPLGQNSLYGYTMHVVIIGLFYVILPYLPGHITERGLINTSLQLAVLGILWLTIRRSFAFDIIPR